MSVFFYLTLLELNWLVKLNIENLTSLSAMVQFYDQSALILDLNQTESHAFPKALTSRWKVQTSKTTMAANLEAAQIDFTPSHRQLVQPGPPTSMASIPTRRTGFEWSPKLIRQRENHRRCAELAQVCRIIKPYMVRHLVPGPVLKLPRDHRWRAEWTRHRWNCSWNPLQPPLPAPAMWLHLPISLLQQEKKYVEYALV